MRGPELWEPGPSGDPRERYAKPSSRLLRRGRFGGVNTVVLVTKCRHLRRRTDLVAERVAAPIVSALLTAREAGRCYLLAWCLMPDHIHVLLAPREAKSGLGNDHSTVGAPSSGRPSRVQLSPLSRLVADWASSATHLANQATAGHGSIWQEGFHDHTVRRDERIADIVDYIHQNPVRRGLVEHTEDWPWSSASPRFSSLTDWDWFAGNAPPAEESDQPEDRPPPATGSPGGPGSHNSTRPRGGR